MFNIIILLCFLFCMLQNDLIVEHVRNAVIILFILLFNSIGLLRLGIRNFVMTKMTKMTLPEKRKISRGWK